MSAEDYVELGMMTEHTAAEMAKGVDEGDDWLEHCRKRLNYFGFRKGEVDSRDFEKAAEMYTKMARTTTPRRRGLFVCGGWGNGKTTLMRAIYTRTNRRVRFIDLADPRQVDAIDLIAYDFAGVNALMEYDYVLDDFGHESIKNDYGVSRDIVGEFISYYYYNGKGRLSIVTNMMEYKDGRWDNSRLLEKHDGSILDRIKELCFACPFVGPSLRKW